jgi:hypothetical protein
MSETELPNENTGDAPVVPQRSLSDNAEAMRVLAEADVTAQQGLDLEPTGLSYEMPEAPSIPMDIQDPHRAHDLCYKQVLRMLQRYLKGYPPKARAFVRKEIRLFLNEGATSGRDMRQTYYYLYEQAIVVIQAWVRQYGGSNVQALFIGFRELNDAREARSAATDGNESV